MGLFVSFSVEPVGLSRCAGVNVTVMQEPRVAS
jgi:hypothetical protein